MVNYYQLLEVSPHATPEQIKTAYKRKALRFHPDKNPDTEELFKEINNAYQVLSDTEARNRYDISLEYQDNVHTAHVRTRPYPAAYQYYKYQQQRKQYHTQWLSRENLTATLFAFIFALVVAALVMSAVWVNDYYNEQEYAKYMAERRQTYENAQAAFDQGQYRETLDLLVSLGGLRMGEADIDNYKSMVISKIHTLGMESYQRKQFSKAIKYFALLEGFSLSQTINFQKILAECYLGIGQYKEGLNIFREMLVTGYRDVEIVLKIAQTYEYKLEDHALALKYYEWGNEIATNDYKAIYGKAYSLLLHKGNIPSNHYDIYLGLARTYQQLGQHQQAIDCAEWSVAMWPDSTSNFLIRAESALALNKTDLACKEFSKASKLDKNISIPAICR